MSSIYPSAIIVANNDLTDNVKNMLVLNINKKNTDSNVNFGSKIEGLAKSYNNIYNLNKGLAKSDTVDSGSTYIIKQPPTPYGQSSPSEFYQGTINPLNKRILKQNINIDTRFRENYYSSPSTNFNITLPLIINNVFVVVNHIYNINLIHVEMYFLIPVCHVLCVFNVGKNRLIDSGESKLILINLIYIVSFF
jgi:hypothetical protein